MSEPKGAPADFGGQVIPNPTGIQPEWDSTHAPRAQQHPGGAIMDTDNASLGDMQGNIDNAPLNTPETERAFPELKGPHQDSRKLSHERPTDNATQAAMRQAGVDMNLDNYLVWAYAGDPPEIDKMDGEDIAMLPPEFQKEVRDQLAKAEREKAATKKKSTK